MTTPSSSLSLGDPATLPVPSFRSPALTPWLRSLGPVTRTLSLFGVLTAIGTSLPFTDSFILSRLALVPQNTIGKFYVWNVITGGFTEISPYGVIPAMGLAIIGGFLEQVWGSKEMIIFVIVVNVFSLIGVYVWMLVLYIITRYSNFIFTPVGGLAGILAAQTVAIKQLIPEHEVGISSFKIRFNYFPLLALLLQIVLTAFKASSTGQLIFIVNALYISWLYLRFLQYRDGTHGDCSGNFAISTCFPDPMRPFVDILANLTAKVCGACIPKLNVPTGTSQESNAETKDYLLHVNTSHMDAADAERRRQRANVALEERLRTKNVNATTEPISS